MRMMYTLEETSWPFVPGRRRGVEVSHFSLIIFNQLWQILTMRMLDTIEENNWPLVPGRRTGVEASHFP